ncbi:MAG TPA: hypothetical protein VHO66_00005 [Ruminiclostridium sp.]|nr:hypothetical protein [Ruminiclostridium sp.]
MSKQRLNKRNKSNRFFAVVLAISLIMAFFGLNAAALQSNVNQNKTANFDGYRVVASNKIELIFDKPPQVPDASGAQFKLYIGAGTTGSQIAIAGAAIGTDNPRITMTAAAGTGFYFPNGGSYVLTTAANLTAGTTYTLVMSNTVVGGSGFTFGHTNSNRDITFSFTCPDTIKPGSNAYSVYNSAVAPTINFKPNQNSTNVSLEGNVFFTTSVPVANYSQVLSGMVLKRNGVTVSYAPRTTSSTVSNSYDCYAPVYNDDHTFFGFLLTQGTSTYYDFNWKPNSTYTLSVPAIQTINGKTIPAQTFTFTTMNGDTPGKITSNVTVTASGTSAKIGWNAVVAGPAGTENTGWPAATGYNVYVSTNPYWGFVKLNTSLIAQPVGAVNTTPVSYTTYMYGLKGSTRYYVRVAPVCNGFEGGRYCGTSNVSFVTPAAAATTVTVSGSGTVTIPKYSAYSRTLSYKAAVKDQFGNTMSGQTVTWSLLAPVAGVSISPTTGVVTVSNTAIAGSSYTVVATKGTLKGSKVTTVAAPKVTSIGISGPTSITKPVTSTTATYTATVYDQCWYTMSGQTVSWKLMAPVAGVSISSTTGVVTVNSTAVSKSTFTVVATVGTVTGSKTVTIA